MPRKLRFIPKTGTLVEITCRTIHGRFLLKPKRDLNHAIVGALARAKRRYGVRICAAVFLSNHYHLLVQVDDARQLARFMGFVNAKIAKEVARTWSWRDKVWARRYQAVVVSDEEEAQIARLRYLLGHGVKEGLVARCADWPGVHCAAALSHDRKLTGYWFDRTKEHLAPLRDRQRCRESCIEREDLTFDPLPCWGHLARARYRRRICALVATIEKQGRDLEHRSGRRPLGAAAIRRQHAHARPSKHISSPAPAFHAASKRIRRSLVEGYRWFVAAYRFAADLLRAGVPSPPFPDGCFPPALPFVEMT